MVQREWKIMAEFIATSSFFSLQDEYFVLNDHTFRKTTWNGISVIQDMTTGYYNFVSACKENHKRFNNWRRNKRTERYLRVVHEIYGLEIEFTDAGIPASGLLYRIDVSGKDLANGYAELQGYYIHPNLFHDVCCWANKPYAVKVSRPMNLINERNRLLNQTLEQTIHQLQDEIAKLKQENSNLEDQLLDKHWTMSSLSLITPSFKLKFMILIHL